MNLFPTCIYLSNITDFETISTRNALDAAFATGSVANVLTSDVVGPAANLFGKSGAPLFP